MHFLRLNVDGKLPEQPAPSPREISLSTRLLALMSQAEDHQRRTPVGEANVIQPPESSIGFST